MSETSCAMEQHKISKNNALEQFPFCKVFIIYWCGSNNIMGAHMWKLYNWGPSATSKIFNKMSWTDLFSQLTFMVQIFRRIRA